MRWEKYANSNQGLRDTTRRRATLRDAESSYDKVVLWTGGGYDYDDVARAPVRLDRREMRTGTSGQNGKTLSVYFTDPEADEPTTAPRSEVWIQPSIDRPHWIEVLDALQEDVDFCEDGETTIVRDGVIAILGVLHFWQWSGGDRGRE